MPLVFVNKNSLRNAALIPISDKKDNISIKTEGDFVFIFSDSSLVGINIFNFAKYFDFLEGVHSLNKKQIAKIESFGYKLPEHLDFTVGEIISREPHPKSQKLFVLRVQCERELQIVTNSLDYTIGKKVVVGRIGTFLPSGECITFSKVLNVESEGMICGSKTLNIDPNNSFLEVKGTNGEEFTL